MPFDRPTQTSCDVAGTPEPLLVVPLGSWEQHGPHLPLDTDTRIAEELAARLIRHRPDAVRGPTIGVSSSGEHAGFAGTLSIGGLVLTEMIVEIVRSAHWATAVVIVNGHGGNISYFDELRTRLANEGHSVLFWSPSLVDPTDSHAGYVETSVMLAMDPDSVRTGAIEAGPTAHLGDILDELRRHGVRSVSPSGVLGDPRRADPALGAQILSSWEDNLIAAVDEWRSASHT